MTPTSRRTRSPRGSGELLAEEIIDAATSLLLDSEAASAVSIRAVADRVGVTPPSIYLHFADKDALLEAVCARYFEQLDEKLVEASAGIDDLLERTLQMGMAYVRFAVDTPVLYREAFHHVSPADQRTKVDEVLAASAFVRLTGTVSELADAGMFRDDEVRDVVLELWTTAHGLASLMIAKPGLGWGDDLAIAEQTLRSVCLGRAVLSIRDYRQPDEVRGFLDALSAPSDPPVGQEKVKSELERVDPR
ncbi:TetR/AcrR family transcriptional regulator [Gordonia aichiensis]